MYLCYIDESGTPDVPGNTSHFILAGISIPIWKWKSCDKDIQSLKSKYGLESAEIHTGWMHRTYDEQNKIPGFDELSRGNRRNEVVRYRNAKILRLQASGETKKLGQTKKNYKHTLPYVHLTKRERLTFLKELAETIGNWGFARIYAECIDKLHFDPTIAGKSISEQAFEQVISRFEQYLSVKNSARDVGSRKYYGILIHDNNQNVEKKHTELMKKYHQVGTIWTRLTCIIETPLFVNSELTSLVQVSDFCAFVIRRYLENEEQELFTEVFKRADRRRRRAVGIRHFTDPSCRCDICQNHT